MNSKIDIDRLLLAKWKKKFNLKFDWDSRIPAVLAGIYSLSLLAEDVESEYYMAEQELIINQNPSLKMDFSLSSDIISEREFDSFSYLKLKSTVSFKNNILVVLNSKLIKTKNLKLNNSQSPNFKKELNSKRSYCWRTFSKNEIKSFADLSGDLNSIHLNSDPVVQGMLILLTFEDFLAQKNRFAQKIKIKYFKPSRADKSIYLSEIERNRFLGLVDDQVNFEINIKENLKCSKK
ncbi:hypothetical protein SAMN04488598_101126 [Halanaerobium congolense]|jgi:ABC-type amino acid transport substrate-binding protein|uniref:MaoC-like domain-containing protein n=1 Tax=Halanaerobium congolense TaxID=54121 RepID=A0A1G7F0P2_9FIRM|nr:hypothetical protein [Halanaerobium congolense]PTX17064.1 hypothetical protein C7953_1818 [Halanaerobium congolense]PXV66011.1 hypothetical protein C8C78_11263 [Halanaerobium congolense]SDE69427.1 hypothetical protein SAMN04488598_101126 [Halanaerobium congolense]SES61873.1 hypothetical protein SAMN04515652_101165 [Halanaerobium congolense]SFO82465.1 hypothetical protein SAMN04488596_101126 [Halanaerobium congolense]